MNRGVWIGWALLVACRGSETAATTTPPATPAAPVFDAGPGPASTANSAAQAGPLASVFTTDPSALASLLASAAAAAPAFLAAPAANADPAETGLRAAAAQFAPGMKPEGEVAKANLTEGGHASFTASLDPSKCYAIVAHGTGATDLDVNLLMPPFYNLLVGQDGMTGANAVIGASPTFVCPVVAFPAPYKIDLFAKKGGGPVAAQVYSKPK